MEAVGQPGRRRRYGSLILHDHPPLLRRELPRVDLGRLLLRYLRVLQQTYSDNHPQIGDTMFKLASHCGWFTPRGAQLQQLGCEMLGRTLGKDHPWYLEGLMQIAKAHFEMGDSARGTAIARAVCDCYKRNLRWAGRGLPGP